MLELLKQRRVWAGLVAVVSFGLQALSVNYQIDVPVLTDLLTAFGNNLSLAISAGLGLWSYFQPKS